MPKLGRNYEKCRECGGACNRHRSNDGLCGRCRHIFERASPTRYRQGCFALLPPEDIEARIQHLAARAAAGLPLFHHRRKD